MLQRLQKIIARAGVASRRHAEQLILAGEVRVNGHVVTELGSKADPEHDSIRVRGKVLRPAGRHLYLAFHKPADCVSTLSDPEGRTSLRDFLRGVGGRVFPVGRLDYHASGLLLLTSDGEFTHRLLRAARSLPQTYWLKLKGGLDDPSLREVARRTGARLRAIKSGPNPWYEAEISGTRRDLLRQALVQLGHPVEKLRRVRLGEVSLDSISPGHYRHLTPFEIQSLGRAAARAERLFDPAVRRHARVRRLQRKPRKGTRIG